MTLHYRSGEEIKKGDHVLFHGNAAEVELVACDPNDPEAAWYIEEYGGGVMILDPARLRPYIHSPPPTRRLRRLGICFACLSDASGTTPSKYSISLSLVH